MRARSHAHFSNVLHARATARRVLARRVFARASVGISVIRFSHVLIDPYKKKQKIAFSNFVRFGGFLPPGPLRRGLARHCQSRSIIRSAEAGRAPSGNGDFREAVTHDCHESGSSCPSVLHLGREVPDHRSPDGSDNQVANQHCRFGSLCSLNGWMGFASLLRILWELSFFSFFLFSFFSGWN